jgi:hypothetical protein
MIHLWPSNAVQWLVPAFAPLPETVFVRNAFAITAAALVATKVTVGLGFFRALGIFTSISVVVTSRALAVLTRTVVVDASMLSSLLG